MMKLILTLSILGNLVLGYMLISDKPEAPVRERLIIETHKEPKPREVIKPVETRGKVVSPVPPKKEQQKEKKEIDPPDFVGFDSYELQDSGERMETRRNDFMMNELGMSEEKIQQHNELRNDFFKETSQFYDKNPMGELSFEERRQLIDLEEMFHKRLEKLHGKENWNRYQKFREDYNTRGYKKQMQDGQPFIFMTL